MIFFIISWNSLTVTSFPLSSPAQQMMDDSVVQSIWPISTWLCNSKQRPFSTFEPQAHSYMNGFIIFLYPQYFYEMLQQTVYR